MFERIFNRKENKKDNENSILLDLIKDNSGPDPFWEECLIKYFENVNKTEQEKIEFFSNLINDEELFNEFTKEIVGPSNVDEIFNKYNKIMNDKENNQYIFYKKMKQIWSGGFKVKKEDLVSIYLVLIKRKFSTYLETTHTN